MSFPIKIKSVSLFRSRISNCLGNIYGFLLFIQEKRFHNWLENARDWAVSRSRFWGTPLPVWISEDGEEIVVMDSIEKLEKLSGAKVRLSLSLFNA